MGVPEDKSCVDSSLEWLLVIVVCILLRYQRALVGGHQDHHRIVVVAHPVEGRHIVAAVRLDHPDMVVVLEKVPV